MPLSVVVTVTPLSGVVGQTVFEYRSAPSGGTPPYTFAWVFSEGSTSNLQNTAEIFFDVGVVTAKLTVTDHNLQQAVGIPSPVTVLGGPTSGTLGNLVAGRHRAPSISTPDRVQVDGTSGGN